MQENYFAYSAFALLENPKNAVKKLKEDNFYTRKSDTIRFYFVETIKIWQ